jgi:hypothetical protein
MTRWTNPLIFFGAAVRVAWYNASHEGSQLLFPFTEKLTDGDVTRAGALSWMLFAAIGALLACWAIVATIRDHRAARALDADTEN